MLDQFVESLACHAHSHAFFRNHPAEDMASASGLQGFFDIRFGDDRHPADAHIKGVKSILRIHMRKQLSNARQIHAAGDVVCGSLPLVICPFVADPVAAGN